MSLLLERTRRAAAVQTANPQTALTATAYFFTACYHYGTGSYALLPPE